MDKINLELTIDQAEFLAALVGVMPLSGCAPIMKMLGRDDNQNVACDVYDTLSDAGVNIHRVLKCNQFGPENPELPVMGEFWRQFALKIEEEREKREEKIKKIETLQKRIEAAHEAHNIVSRAYQDARETFFKLEDDMVNSQIHYEKLQKELIDLQNT